MPGRGGKGEPVMWGLALPGNKNGKILELIPGNKTNWLTAKCGTGFCAQSLVVQAEPRALHPGPLGPMAGEGLSVTPNPRVSQA